MTTWTMFCSKELCLKQNSAGRLIIEGLFDKYEYKEYR